MATKNSPTTYQQFLILHISDLHFSKEGPPGERVSNDERVDDEITIQLKRQYADRFLSGIQAYMHDHGFTKWPGIVIVNGDLVNHGGEDANPTDGKTEFDQAIAFLKKLLNILGLPNQSLYVVPGNHDLYWKHGYGLVERFDNYFKATKLFRNVKYQRKAEKILPAIYKVGQLKDGTSIEIMLLTSTLFGGTRNMIYDSIFDAIKKQGLGDLSNPKPSPEDIDRYIDTLKANIDPLDLALVGQTQLEAVPGLVKRRTENDRIIRIAVLHHHLLPHPQASVTKFETVLDAGLVLDNLLENHFDLILTGHKHNRRLVKYEVKNHEAKNRVLDVYTGPSLFMPHNIPGFTIIELFGAATPFYATLHHYNTRNFELANRQMLPQRNALIDRAIEASIQISAIDGSQMFDQSLPEVEKALRWQHEWVSKYPQSHLLQHVLEQIYVELKSTGQRVLSFREPKIMLLLMELIETLDPSLELRVVSRDDLDYWDKALQHLEEITVEDLDQSDERADTRQTSGDLSIDKKPALYMWVLRQFPGRKIRILVLDKAGLKNNPVEAEQASRVIDLMRTRGRFEVMFVDKNRFSGEMWTDFALVGDIAVYFFEDVHSYSRALKVHFDENHRNQGSNYWQRLERVAKVSGWWSENPDKLTFEQWLQQD